jgi:hypothetical protein
MGTGRCGTTMLQLLLASAPNAVAAGELFHLSADYAADTECTCARAARDCQVWGRVHALLEEEASQDYSKAEWHGRFVFMLLGALPAGYAHYQTRLFDAIGVATGAEVIIDSSKFAGRALGLRRALGQRVKVICVSRSPEGLLQSFKRDNKGEQVKKSVFQTVKFYIAVNSMIRMATLRLGDVLEISYDELISDPSETLGQIQRHTGLDLSEAMSRVERGEPFPVGHILTGNRLRKQGEVVFQPDKVMNKPVGVERCAAGVMRLWGRMLRFL